jgi:hypothetical protein
MWKTGYRYNGVLGYVAEKRIKGHIPLYRALKSSVCCKDGHGWNKIIMDTDIHFAVEVVL